MENNKQLTINEAAKYLNVSKITLQRWDKNGKLPAIKTAGGHRRYKLSDLEKFNQTERQCTYGTLYEHLCNSQFHADELNKRGLINNDICKDLLRIREEVGRYYLNDYFNKTIN